jgi:hypothetical protein
VLQTGEVKKTEIPTIIKPNPQADDQSNKLFIVSSRVETREIVGRDEAVAAAKEWTVEEPISVTVERDDGRVKMQFRSGALVDYVFETRKGRKA